MASQQTSLNDLIAKFNIITIFHLLACRDGGLEWFPAGGSVAGDNSGFLARAVAEVTAVTEKTFAIQ